LGLRQIGRAVRGGGRYQGPGGTPDRLRSQPRNLPHERYNPAEGVVNKWGQSHDIDNLFVSDGSQFTSNNTGNPTLTIVALAIRQAEYIAEQMRTNEF